MSNWQRPPQWNTPQGNFGQPQQNQGWGQGAGQWQQAPPPGQGFYNTQQQFPVHHQTFPQNQGPGGGGGGFVTGQAGGHAGGFQVGGSGLPPGGVGGVGQQPFTGFPHQQQQQQQFQAMQQRQQQQQMAYLQEQQRLAREEQKKRDLEIQKRKLMNINVANPSASSLSFDDLVSIKPSSSPRSSPKVNRPVQEVSVQKTTPPIAKISIATASSDDPLPTTCSSTVTAKSAAPTTVAGGSGQISGRGQAPPPTTAQSDNTFEKLIESSLSNIKDVSPARSRKTDFKTSTSGAKPPPHLASNVQQKTFSESMRARAWTGDGRDFSGVFAQHMQAPPGQGAAMEGDDSFGEFQSVGGTGADPALAMMMVGSTAQPPHAANSQTIGLNGSQVLAQPSHAPLPGQQLNSGAGNFPTQPMGGSVHSGNTIPTSAYQHPISSTSVARDKPLSPTHFSNLDPSRFPRLYTTVFERCSKPGEAYMDTELLFPLLLSSQLPKNVLRDLWTVANKEIPGKLNQTELFVLLGLIALAQSGNPSPTAQDLKKAPSLPIPKLSALEEAVPSAPTSAQTLVTSQAPPPQPLHRAAPPPSSVDDFGDFQQGQGSSFQPSFPPRPLVPTSGRPLAPAAGLPGQTSLPASSSSMAAADKYSVFDELKSSSSDLLNVQTTDATGLTSATTGLPAPTATASGTGDDFGFFSSAPPPSSSAPPPSSSSFLSTVAPQQSKDGLLTAPPASVPPSGGSDGGFADFASFQSAPPIGGAMADTSSQEGWAAFGEFTSTSSQGVSSNQDVLFPPPGSFVPTIPPTSTLATKSKADSAFDALLPAELLPSKTSKAKEPPESNTLITSITPVVATSSAPLPSSTSKGLDLTMFESEQPSPQSKKKKEVKKQLTGLEILEEEFSARVSAKASSSSSAVDMSEPLVPESAPLDEFGEFEAYSSPGREKKGDLPLGGVSTRDSPPGLRKSSSDPLKVWSGCLSKCSEILESCASVFDEVKDQSVLEEIALSEEGRNKLKGIVEVYRLAKRVYRPFREKKEDAERDACVQSIQKQWKKLFNALPNNIISQLYTDTTPACVEEEDVLSDSISKCSLCVSSKTVSIPPHLSLDGKKEDYTMSLLFHGGQSYHPSCANFWLNVVQEELPVLT